MMDYIEVKAKTVDDAIIEASIQLETSSDNIEYEVIERGSSGFLGFGSKPAGIRARKKEEYSSSLNDLDLDLEIKKEPKREEKKEIKREPKKETGKPQQRKPEPRKPEAKPAEPKKPEPRKPELQKSEERPFKEEKEAVKKAPIDHAAAEENAIQFLNATFKAMKLQVEVKAAFDEDENLNVDLSGPEMGILIGKRGQTLDSIQYLTSLVVNKENGSYIRVKVDTEDYRRRRRETLENLAKNIASKVRRTKKPVFLEPMNPYERRIIHSALQNNPYVSTHSEGEEPYRKVVVTLKK